MPARFDAAIVGAGPAGAAAAILLARAGWTVALVERQRYPRRKVCGECIAATNLPLLDALGIGDAVHALAGAELRRVALLRGARSVVASLPAAEAGPHRFGRALGREHLDTLLVAQARAYGATVRQPVALDCLEGRPGRYRLHVRGTGEGGEGGELEAAVVIAAHGSWEPLPSEREGRRAMRRPSDLFAFKANFRDARLDADLLPVLSFPGGYGGMVIADAGLATLACCVREDRLDEERSAAGARRAGDAVEAMLRRECGGVAEALAPAVREGPWLSTGPIRPGIRLGAGDGVFRIGNAAGEAHPIVGEGISMALQSAFLLASVLTPHRRALVADASASTIQAHALDDYEARWRIRFAPRLRVAAAFAHAAMRPWAAAALWPLVRRWPAVLASGARWSGKTRCVPEAARLVEASR
ncbi:MAG TPA: FAD-dependent oxidoreductase [Caldimonas sp.]|jgi:2-polyprenyl-6-methoxyphenol hydroxylase-like FAD-dependent oxidoreductase|nr:FAD-dependent oxidoreductase [Caldimonas sp.]HEX2540524.1 FAD-dependent oxidoreductase [Caldimonas sp.]